MQVVNVSASGDENHIRAGLHNTITMDRPGPWRARGINIDNVTLAFDLANSQVNEPENVPVEIQWAWYGQSLLVGPVSAQLLFGRTQEAGPLLNTAEGWLLTLLLTAGQDKLGINSFCRDQ